jgi:dUTPase
VLYCGKPVDRYFAIRKETEERKTKCRKRKRKLKHWSNSQNPGQWNCFSFLTDCMYVRKNSNSPFARIPNKPENTIFYHFYAACDFVMRKSDAIGFIDTGVSVSKVPDGFCLFLTPETFISERFAAPSVVKNPKSGNIFITVGNLASKHLRIEKGTLVARGIFLACL